MKLWFNLAWRTQSLLAVNRTCKVSVGCFSFLHRMFSKITWLLAIILFVVSSNAQNNSGPNKADECKSNFFVFVLMNCGINHQHIPNSYKDIRLEKLQRKAKLFYLKIVRYQFGLIFFLFGFHCNFWNVLLGGRTIWLPRTTRSKCEW